MTPASTTRPERTPTWSEDKSLTDTDSLPAPDIIATEIADNLETALEQFTRIAARLSSCTAEPS